MNLITTVAILSSILAQAGELVPTTKGRVVAVNADTVTIAVRAGEEPAIGDKVEVYIDLPDLDGIAVLAVGRVTEVKEAAAVARLDSKTGRIDKNHLVRLTSAKTSRTASKPVPEIATESAPTPAIAAAAVTPDASGAPMPPPVPESPTPLPPQVIGTKQSPPPPPGTIAPPLGSNSSPQPSAVDLALRSLPSLPASLPSEQPSGDFAGAVRNFQHAVLSIGDPTRASWGTGFVISRSHRLVATNAHVADIAKIAVLNESRTNYKVERIWYHPGVIRIMDDGKTLIQSTNPADGEVHTECADVAVLKLESVGPDLPAEVVLASPEEAYGIMGSHVGILGYPGYQHDQAIKPDLFASATFVQGSISRMTGLRHTPDAALPHRQSVAYDARTFGGFSGSPVFHNNGHVVAVHNHSHHESGERTLAQGLRVDVLWELLHREKLCDIVPGEPLGLIEQVSVVLPVDPRVEKLRRARQLLKESADLILHDEFQEAQHALEDAKLITPDYWRLHWQTSLNITHLLGDEWDHLTTQQKVAWTRESLKHLQTAATLYQQSFGRTNVRLVLDQVRELVSLGRVGGDKVSFQKALAMLGDEQLFKAASGQQPAYLLALRGSVKTDLNDLPGALVDLNDAIRMSPNAKDFYKNRAWVWTKMGQPTEAARDRQRFEQLLEAEHHHHHD